MTRKIFISKLVTAATLTALLSATFYTNADEAELAERVRKVLSETPLIDGHNDLPFAYTWRVKGDLEALPIHEDLSGMDNPPHTDLARLREGQLGGQFWSVYIPISAYPGADGDTARVLRQIDIVYRMIERYPDDLALALTAADVRRIHKQGKIASMMGIEGGHAIENSLPALRMLFELGVRYMTLTHSKGLDWVDSATDAERVGGLSPFGVEVIREMNRLGMLIDLSHVSAATMHDVLDVTSAPVIFSHSSAYGMTSHPRNIPDSVLDRLKENNGVAMVTFFPSYVSDEVNAAWTALRDEINQETDDPAEQRRIFRQQRGALPRPLLSDVADHIDYIRDRIGIDYIGLGGDYDGMPPGPIGLDDVSDYPALFVELLRRGYSDEDIAKIAGNNVLRAMEAAEAVAREEQASRPPSNAFIDDLDSDA